MDLATAIRSFDEQIADPSFGLPEDVFLLVSRLTPLVNVDLLVRDESGRTLLTWRHDAFFGPGWHVPGGIVRFKEKIADRVRRVADGELGIKVRPSATPLACNEIFHPTRSTRGHFISFLYVCIPLETPPAKRRLDPCNPVHGAWEWHDLCPDNLIGAQGLYRDFIGRSLKGDPYHER